MISNGFTDALSVCLMWVNIHFVLYLSVFAVALFVNFNFNIVMVGLIYLIPLMPLGLTMENAPRFLIVTFQNMVFGVIELVIFVITVQKADVVFDKNNIKQLVGHTLPIAVALIGLSFVGRVAVTPLGFYELIFIFGLFLVGSVGRVLAVYQIGSVAFKFDIVFRDQQRLKSDQLYAWVRHPSYLAMMLVILAYAINANSLLVALLGLVSAWFGFQYRIFHEEKALEKLKKEVLKIT